MSLFRRSSTARTTPKQGRPGMIRAVGAGIGAMLLGVVAISGLRMASAQDGTGRADIVPTSAAAIAMTQLTTPPAPGTFGVAEQAQVNMDAPSAPLLLASDTTAQPTDCVRQLEQYLAPISVNFDKGSSDVDARNVPLLSRISEEIMACDAAYVMVAGHADGSGEDAVNLALSWERADRTLNALLMLGVDPFAVEALGFGARAPLSQGSDEEDIADRRVDFRVMRRP